MAMGRVYADDCGDEIGMPTQGTRRKQLELQVDRAKLALREAELRLEAHDERAAQMVRKEAEYKAMRERELQGAVDRITERAKEAGGLGFEGNASMLGADASADVGRDVLDLTERAGDAVARATGVGLDDPQREFRRPLFGRPEVMGSAGVEALGAAPNGDGSDH